MSTFIYSTPTNDTKRSQYDVLGHLMPARMFVFVVVDEPGKDGFLVRNCYARVDDPHLLEMNLGRVGNNREVYPFKEGLWGRNPSSTASIAEHVL